jgi:hypothetical protein
MERKRKEMVSGVENLPFVLYIKYDIYYESHSYLYLYFDFFEDELFSVSVT